MAFERSTTALGVMSSWLTPMTFFVAMNLMIVAIFFKSGFSLGKTKLQKSDSDHVPSMLRKLKSVNSLFRFPSFNASQTRETASYQAASTTETASYQTVEYDPEELVELVRRETNSASTRSAFRHFREAEVVEMNTTHLQTTATTSFEESVQLPMMSEKLEILHLSPTDGNDYEAEDRFEAVTLTNNNMSMNEIFSQLQRQGSEINRTKSDTGAVPVKLVKKMKKSASSKSAFKNFHEAEILEARRPATVKESKIKRAAENEEDDDDVEVDSKADDFINMFKQHLKLQKLDSILRYKEMLERGSSK